MELTEDQIKRAHAYARYFVNSKGCSHLYEELVSPCLFGIKRAEDTWDESKNVSKKEWYRVCMRSEALDYLRTLDDLDRKTRKQVREGELEFEIQHFEFTHMTDLLKSEKPSPLEILIQIEQNVANVKRLLRCLSKLDQRSRDIVREVYFGNKNQKQLADQFNLTEGRISQIVTRAISKMAV